VWFQQDGAAPHTANRVLTWFEETFGEHLISLRSDIEWPPHSPDLNPLDFFLWGYLKDRVDSPPPSDLAEIKSAITREITKIQLDTCKEVVRNFKNRLQIVVAKKGGHLEHII